jgi:hypothetical protein
MTPEHLELLAGYHHGLDVVERLKSTLIAQDRQAEGLRAAAAEIRRLKEEIKRLEAEREQRN